LVRRVLAPFRVENHEEFTVLGLPRILGSADLCDVGSLVNCCECSFEGRFCENADVL
jgi:hypothetical protein